MIFAAESLVLKADLPKPESRSAQTQAKPLYVNIEETLGAPLPSSVPWTNDPEVLLSYPYFQTKPLMNLASSYRIPGLRPVMKHKLEYIFLLMDDQERFYLWFEEDGLRIFNKDLDIQEAINEAIEEPFPGELAFAI